MGSIMRIKNEQGEWESVVSIKGEGVQPGGSTGQYLVKKSNDDFDTEWASPTGGGDMLKSVYDPQGKNTDVFGYVDGKAQTLINNAIGALTKSSVGLSNVDNVKQIPYSEKGANNGVAELDESGKVLVSQLPSYVSDVIEEDSLGSFPPSGEAGKIYIAKDTNKTYRWTGSTYIEVGDGGVALGETSATAYRGDRGKIAYDHSQVAHAPANAQKNSDITKAEIEAKLTGAITTHTHGLYFENITVTDWIADSTYEDYGYRAEINCQGVTSQMFADVVFSPESAVIGLAPVCKTDTNKVTIYAISDEEVTILTIKAQ